MQVRDIATFIESLAPLAYQESYDNSGLQIGSPDDDVSGVLITLDITEAVVDEAIHLGLNFILAHHPLIFSGLKKITGRNEVERCVVKAIQHKIAVYVAHTNLDSVPGGVNTKMAEKLGLINCRMLGNVEGQLKKLVTFVPVTFAEKVRNALFDAGAGNIGNYDSCSFNLSGQGTFRAGEGSNPFVGEKGQLHFEEELRIETIYPKHLQHKIIAALLAAHPYEEVAYDIYPLENANPQVGIGVIGELPEPMEEIIFLKKLKETFYCGVVKHTALRHKTICKVALIGGSGSSFLGIAKAAGADVFVSGDFKYHQFFDAEGKILIADIGHFESEQFTKELFCELLTKKFPKFAVRLSEVITNPVNYLI